jgi:hypothetical protein
MVQMSGKGKFTNKDDNRAHEANDVPQAHRTKKSATEVI